MWTTLPLPYQFNTFNAQLLYICKDLLSGIGTHPSTKPTCKEESSSSAAAAGLEVVKWI
jgi:hypothetical protein